MAEASTASPVSALASGAFTSGAEGVAVSGLVGLKMTVAGVLLARCHSAAGLLAVFSGRGAKMTGSRRVGCPAWSVVLLGGLRGHVVGRPEGLVGFALAGGAS
ncbi:hypothetical protein [Streptosporangium vulgare]|uniref:hypothetical protein n=1 Tax=Streptosporangium vulgare TaxID=46190 RepID=UPI0031DABAD8